MLHATVLGLATCPLSQPLLTTLDPADAAWAHGH